MLAERTLHCSMDQFNQLSDPRILGHFSVDRDQSIRFDHSNAKYLYQKHVLEGNVNIDLNAGFDQFQDWTAPSAVGYQAICRWLMHEAPAGSDIKQALQGADFLCSRGVLKKVAASPYSGMNSWSFVAVKKNDVIYICETRRKPGSLVNVGQHQQDLASYWGVKFEQCMQTDHKNGVPDITKAVVPGDEYRAVVSTTLTSAAGTSPIKLVVCGEVDCLDEDGSFVELKTHANSLDWKFWRNKSRDTYIQCRLLGVRNAVIGLRNWNGQVQQVVKMSDDQLRLGGAGQWDFNDCMTFLHTILSDVRTSLEGNKACFYEKASNSQVTKSYSVSPADLGFLTDEFKAHFNLH